MNKKTKGAKGKDNKSVAEFFSIDPSTVTYTKNNDKIYLDGIRFYFGSHGVSNFNSLNEVENQSALSRRDSELSSSFLASASVPSLFCSRAELDFSVTRLRIPFSMIWDELWATSSSLNDLVLTMLGKDLRLGNCTGAMEVSRSVVSFFLSAFGDVLFRWFLWIRRSCVPCALFVYTLLPRPLSCPLEWFEYCC
ncbi:hypothetical protein BpHYR1_029988 [Brachionus plicatilis]|uniref:Uncharacterized protein n=1 Tax=Brachionus plicatilis TaxID=10195 RepID=A0A3M7QTD2_BRAPC|nr:hypothetical protein BpHYR1_029988 [Brachionus plicatilis]